ncbi:DNA excision repair protein ERCC-1 [Ambystoma mexicanum]|uniref:DNA excision repair protein ERCC-1 n=1 Tax=Ambystoma mexicanum TaxID=8296 RepID=UPI0037E7F4E0
MSEDDGPAERKKRFTVPSDDLDVTPVKPLFRSLAAGDLSARGEMKDPPQSTGTYAEYVFKQAAGVTASICPGGDKLGATSTSLSRAKAAGSTVGAGREFGTGLAERVASVSRVDNAVGQPAGTAPHATCISAIASGSSTLPPASSAAQAGPLPNVDAAESLIQAAGVSGEGRPAVPAKAIGKGSCLIVSPRQRGNPILKFVRNVPWEFDEIVPDYVMGPTTCALYLSLRYHNLNPNYIHERLKVLGQSFALRVLLVQVDVKDPHFALKELAKICILADCTLILAWSAEEAGRYLETYKSYEQKPADVLKEKVDQDFMSKMTDVLTTVKSVNKTDCTTLLSTFGSLADLTNATREDLSLCPGLGPQKAKRLFDVLHEPFQKTKN